MFVENKIRVFLKIILYILQTFLSTLKSMNPILDIGTLEIKSKYSFIFNYLYLIKNNF